MDIDKLSDEEVTRLYNEQIAQKKVQMDIDKMSDEEVQRLYSEKFEGAVAKSDIIEEMHPSISSTSRLLVKNFGNNLGVDYLKKQHPDLEIKEQEGRVLVRGKGEKKYKVLDPDTGALSWDMLRDIGDVAFDTAAGIAEGLAATTAGVAAAPTGAGSIPAAMAAAGATGAAGEALRQKIGHHLGINKEIDYGDVATVGAVSGLMPSLFGTGASTKQLTKQFTKGVNKKELFKKALSQMDEYAPSVDKFAKYKEVLGEAVEEAASAQRGGFSRAYQHGTRKVVPRFAEMMSGEKAQNFKQYTSNIDLMKSFDESIEAYQNYNDETSKMVINTIDQHIGEVGGQIETFIKKSGLEPNIDDLVNKSLMKIEKLKQSKMPHKRQLAKDLGDEFHMIFGDLDRQGKTKTKRYVKGAIPMDTIYDFRRLAREKANFFKNPNNQKANKQDINNFFMDVYADLNKGIDELLDNAGKKTADGQTAKQLRTSYKEALGLKKLSDKFFDKNKYSGEIDFSKGMNTLNRLENKSQAALKGKLKAFDDRFGTDILERANNVQAYSALKDASWFPKTGTATSTSRTLAVGMMAQAAGGPAATAAGIAGSLFGMSPRAWKLYLSMGAAGENKLKRAIARAGGKVPPNLKEYFNGIMAAQVGGQIATKKDE